MFIIDSFLEIIFGDPFKDRDIGQFVVSALSYLGFQVYGILLMVNKTIDPITYLLYYATYPFLCWFYIRARQCKKSIEVPYPFMTVMHILAGIFTLGFAHDATQFNFAIFWALTIMFVVSPILFIPRRFDQFDVVIPVVGYVLYSQLAVSPSLLIPYAFLTLSISFLRSYPLFPKRS